MLCECWQAVLIRRCACVTDQRPELPDSTPKSGDRWYRLRGEARGGRGRRRMNTFSILIHWKSQTSHKLRKHEQNIQHTSTTSPLFGHQLGKSFPKHNIGDDPSDDLRLQQRADFRKLWAQRQAHFVRACRRLRHEQKGYNQLYTGKLLVPR